MLQHLGFFIPPWHWLSFPITSTKKLEDIKLKIVQGRASCLQLIRPFFLCFPLCQQFLVWGVIYIVANMHHIYTVCPTFSVPKYFQAICTRLVPSYIVVRFLIRSKMSNLHNFIYFCTFCRTFQVSLQYMWSPIHACHIIGRVSIMFVKSKWHFLFISPSSALHFPYLYWQLPFFNGIGHSHTCRKYTVNCHWLFLLLQVIIICVAAAVPPPA